VSFVCGHGMGALRDGARDRFDKYRPAVAVHHSIMLGLRRFWSQSIKFICRTAISQHPSCSTNRLPHQPDK
jgi:hypothetical protein